MIFLLLFIGEFITLLLLSQAFSRIFSRWLLRVTQDTTKTIHIMSFLFLPGVILHEIAHWFIAGMLLVRTGEMEFLPQIQGNSVKLGSVAIAQTDPFRRFVIGIAPILVGLAAMFGLFIYFSPVIPAFNWQTVVCVYSFFEIGNTMFSSKKDMEGAILLLSFILIGGIILYFVGVRLDLHALVALMDKSTVADVFRKLDTMLLIPLCINLLLCAPSFIRKNA